MPLRATADGRQQDGGVKAACRGGVREIFPHDVSRSRTAAVAAGWAPHGEPDGTGAREYGPDGHGDRDVDGADFDQRSDAASDDSDRIGVRHADINGHAGGDLDADGGCYSDRSTDGDFNFNRNADDGFDRARAGYGDANSERGAIRHGRTCADGEPHGRADTDRQTDCERHSSSGAHGGSNAHIGPGPYGDDDAERHRDGESV